MTLWMIEPRDPLLVRDGRPFDASPGSRAQSLPFPLPSTLVGGLRHKAGLDASGAFDHARIAEILTLQMRGPLLAEVDAERSSAAIRQLLFAAPADALALESSDQHDALRLLQLAPRELAGAAQTNQPDGLALVGPQQRVAAKVSQAAPLFWHEAQFMAWLVAPQADQTLPGNTVGIGALLRDTRTHVSVQAATQTAREGALFQTRGLEFTWRDGGAQQQTGSFTTRRLALVAALEHDGLPYAPPHFTGGLMPLAGERRLMHWMTIAQHLPDPPTDLFATICATRRARVVLLTPGIFTAGYRPPLAWERGGVIAHLHAAAVPRAQVISGWDLARGKPKPTRRMAPAGSVYFVTWPEGAEVAAWLAATWMQNVSDSEQDQRDGFGLAALGVWSPH